MRHFPEKLTLSIKRKLGEPAIARQFLAETSPEAHSLSGFDYDAVADQKHRVGRGMIRKYSNRLLLIAHSHCAVHCRYCFRRHFDYASDTFQEEDIPVLLGYLEQHPEIDEIILSGGDPLMLNNQRLDGLIGLLYRQSTIKRIRLHSRVITVLSQRINAELLAIFGKYRDRLVLVTHINHAEEIDDEVIRVVEQLRRLGIMLLNQSVLLKGVNDRAVVLSELSDRLFQVGIMPYYLNLLDRVKGAERFYLKDEEAVAIYRELARQTSGYLLPKLVRDKGEASYKCILGLEA